MSARAGTAPAQSVEQGPNLFIVLGRTFLLGLIVVVFTLNGVLEVTGRAIAWEPLSALLLTLSALPDRAYAAIPINQYFLLGLLFRWIALSLALHAALLLLVSLRHLSLNFLLASLSGFLLGLFSITLISWTILIVVFIFNLFGTISAFFGQLLAAILLWILRPPQMYCFLLPLLLGIGWMLLGVLRSLWTERASVGGALLRLVGAALLLLMAVVVVLLVLAPFWYETVIPLLARIVAWWNSYVTPILLVVWHLFVVLLVAAVGAAVTLVSFWFLGSQLVDQFASSLISGKHTYALFHSSFGAGTVLAVLVLVCSANPLYAEIVSDILSRTVPGGNGDLFGIVYGLTPTSVLSLLQESLRASSIPLFDGISLLLTLFLSSCGLWMTLVSGGIRAPLLGLFDTRHAPPLLLAGLGLVIMLFGGIIDSIAQERS